MTGLYNGRLKKYVGRRDYRIIYYWCQLCRKENRRLDKNCDDCEVIPDNSAIFFDLYHKKRQEKVQTDLKNRDPLKMQLKKDKKSSPFMFTTVCLRKRFD